MNRDRSCRAIVVLAVLTLFGSSATALAVPSPGQPAPTSRPRTGHTRITGRIVDDRGHPLSGVVVHDVTSRFYGRHSTETNSRGRYSLASSPGPQRLTVDGGVARGGDADGVGYAGSLPTLVRARFGQPTTGVDVTMHPAGKVRGRVTDAAGRPLTGVVVWLARVQPYVNVLVPHSPHLAPGTERVPSRHGAFRIGGVQAGAYQLCFDTRSSHVVGGAHDRAGYQTQCGRHVVAITTGAVTSTGSVPLHRSSGGGLYGRVTDRRGRPVAGVQVAPGPLGDHDVTTGLHGWYRIQGLSTRSVRLCFLTNRVHTSTPTGFAPACRSKRVAVRPDHTPRIDETLPTGGAVRGVAQVGDADAPLAGVAVFGAYHPTVGTTFSVEDETSDTGHYLLKNLPAGNVHVCFRPDQSAAAGPGFPFGAAPRSHHHVCHRLTHVRHGRVSRGVDARYRAGGAISGTVRDQHGTPLAGRRIYVSLIHHPSFESSTVTDAHGRYRAVDLLPLTYRVCEGVYDDCYTAGAPQSAKVQAENGKDTTGVDLTRSIKQNHVAVRTVDQDGRALAGTDVVLLKSCVHPDPDNGCLTQPLTEKSYITFGSRPTSATGLAEWFNLHEHSYTVCAFGYYATTRSGAPATGYRDACSASPITVTGSSDQSVRIVLPDAGAVTGRVTTPSGAPLVGVRVRVSGSAAENFAGSFFFRDSIQPRRDAVTDVHGDYTVRSVAPGNQTVCFDPKHVAGAMAYQPQCLGSVPGTKSGGATVVVRADDTTGVNIFLTPK